MASLPQPASPTGSVTKDKLGVEDSRYEQATSSKNVHGDAALEILGDGATRHEFSESEDRTVLRKIDWRIMPVVCMVYLLQQLDKSSVSYASVFGFVEDTGLHGKQYSWLTSILYLAQLVWQPASSYMLVRFPLSKYLFIHVFMWGAIVCCMSAAHNFAGLLVARFFLAPCFITVTQMWWRRREQTFRLSMWMAVNGAAGALGSLVTYGLGHAKSNILHEYQIIFLFIGALTICCSPVVYFFLPDSPSTAKFLTQQEKVVAIERLRANNQGTESKEWKWSQVWDTFLDPKTYLWFLLMFVCATPSGGISAFGPLIINGFGFNQFETIVMNIPFNVIQIIVTLLSAVISMRLKLKSPVIIVLTLFPIGGASALYALGRGPELRNTLLGCYYITAFFTGLQPMLYSWASQNTAGHTKKVTTTGVFFVAQCVGNVVGPLLYKTEDKPRYNNGLVANLICWIILLVLTIITIFYLMMLNRSHARRRVAAGKSAVVVDTSLDNYRADAEKRDGTGLNDRAFDDLTDKENEDFVYVL
ncbi:MFS general substrate transporter [Auriculariales sp. MPI-PUGE-AT-0066]|nr:MFS general substrate transporter [Auriculariales sp. MPI-PUGE-AT-0066]